jgi:site-specific DNA-methyltransferase (adenine-specific)/adenine-specific DNA-methyltransferase
LIEPEFEKLRAKNKVWWGKDGNGVPRQIRYLSEVEGLVPWTWWPHEDVGHTDEAKKEVQSIFGTQTAFDTPKPTRISSRIIQIATNPGDIVLDSFAGSGTTGHAVLKLNREAEDLIVDDGTAAPEPRKFILIEMGEDVAKDVTAERNRRVIEGYTNQKGQEVAGFGGGFRYCELGAPLFDESGQIRDSVKFGELARHVYFTETGEPLPRERVPNSPFVGVCHGVGVYLLFNGILGDKSSNGGNVLNRKILRDLPEHDGPKVIYCAGCLLSRERLAEQGITVRQTPYEIRIS